MSADVGDGAMGVEGQEIEGVNGIECFGPLACGDKTLGVAHTEEDAAGVAVHGADFLVIKGVGVVDGDHVFGENGGIID